MISVNTEGSVRRNETNPGKASRVLHEQMLPMNVLVIPTDDPCQSVCYVDRLLGKRPRIVLRGEIEQVDAESGMAPHGGVHNVR